MPLILAQDGEIFSNSVAQTGAPAVRITGANVRFVNTATGRVESTMAGLPALRIEGAGAVVTNEAGGIIQAFAAGDPAILGSAFADTLISAGTIVGSVSLGGGDDILTLSAPPGFGPFHLDAGDDLLRVEAADSFAIPAVAGGSGVDTVLLAGGMSSVTGGALSGFERLDVASAVLQIDGFSGFGEILLAHARADVAVTHSFTHSVNPDADLAVHGTHLTIGAGSVFRNVTGTDAAETVRLSGIGFETAGAVLGNISLGGGGDRFALSTAGGPAPAMFGTIDGGAGTDTVVLEGQFGQGPVVSYNLVGFERLEVGAEVINMNGFSGFTDIVLAGRVAGAFVTHNFIYSVNPDADLAVHGTYLTVGPGSVFRNVTGSGQADTVQMNSNAFGAAATILGTVELGGGDDVFNLTWRGGAAPAIGGIVDGGAGANVLEVLALDGGTLDLSGFENFQMIQSGIFSSEASIVRLIHADGYTRIHGDRDGTLTLALSNSPDAAVIPNALSTLILESTATVGTVRFFVFPEMEPSIEFNDRQFSMEVINDGNILGDVRFYAGNDLYDGSGGGAVGGIVYGRGGSDRLHGGQGADRFDGGAQGDVLNGGGGGDVFVIAALGDSMFALRSDGAKILPDRIEQFVSGEDRIDLSAIDAVAGTVANDAFAFIGTAAFSHRAGELRYDVRDGYAYIAADVDGDGFSDLAIIAQAPLLQAGDFIL